MTLKKGKIFYSMGEVAEMFDVNCSLIRFWCDSFELLTPTRNSRGHRIFTSSDIDNLKIIYRLVKEKGMTLEGAHKQIKDNRDGVRRDAEIVEKLMNIRSMLMEIRQELSDDASTTTYTSNLDIFAAEEVDPTEESINIDDTHTPLFEVITDDLYEHTEGNKLDPFYEHEIY